MVLRSGLVGREDHARRPHPTAARVSLRRPPPPTPQPGHPTPTVPPPRDPRLSPAPPPLPNRRSHTNPQRNTTNRRGVAVSARFVSASIRFGEVNPAPLDRLDGHRPDQRPTQYAPHPSESRSGSPPRGCAAPQRPAMNWSPPSHQGSAPSPARKYAWSSPRPHIRSKIDSGEAGYEQRRTQQ
jgi:hypothetical protein